MTEEVKQDVVDDAPAPVVSEFEAPAREQGWMSKEEWVEAGKSESDWRPAKEFVERGELFRANHSIKRELSRTQQALTALQRHHQYVFEKAHAKAVSDLKREKREALREGEIERVEQIEEQIEDLSKEHRAQAQQIAQAQATVQSAPPEFQDWVTRNSWYETDSDLRDFADAAGIVFANKNPGIAPSVVLKHVEDKIKKQFPDKFGVRRAAPSAVAGQADRSIRKSSKADDIELDELETKIMNDLVKTGEMTAAEYKAELKKARGY